MKRLTVTLGLVLMLVAAVFGQSRKKYGEFGVAIGTLNMTSDISNSGNVNSIMQETRPSISIFGKQHYNDWFALGIDMNYGFLYANDKNHRLKNRGLTVTTQLFNANVFTEMHLIRFGKFRQDRPFSIFLKGGAGIAGWNPELSIAGQRPENIEVESNAYSSLNLFAAVGCKFRLSYKSILTIEARTNSINGDTMDGFTFIDNTPVDNDSYWGLQFAYSIMIF
jgi:hypothetical protein